jgi:16S rRNA (guanine527-N7)-methyltransferase
MKGRSPSRGPAGAETLSANDRDAALALCPSLRPVLEELEIYESLLRSWQAKINLVAEPTLATIWTRHFADSAQVLGAVPNIVAWADLGSGAGFPGMVLAILLKQRPGAVVHLIESDQRKAAFLRAVSRETAAPAIIHVGRVEHELPVLVGAVGAVTARALAPLPQLVDWSRDHLLKNAVGVYLKGEDWESELTALEAESNFSTRSIVSRTNPAARLISVAREFGAFSAQGDAGSAK